jgi:hypothetical protein
MREKEESSASKYYGLFIESTDTGEASLLFTREEMPGCVEIVSIPIAQTQTVKHLQGTQYYFQ